MLLLPVVSAGTGAAEAPETAAPAAPAAAAPPVPDAPAPPGRARSISARAASVPFWSQEQRYRSFGRMETLFPARRVVAGAHPLPLAPGAPIEAALGGEAAVGRLMEGLDLVGLLVVEDGRVRLERYAHGLGPEKRWTGFSMTKSVTSLLVGAAIRDGFIGSVDDPVTRYAKGLAGSAYEGVTIDQLLTMSSGVRWKEDYGDRESDVVRFFSEPVPAGEDSTVAYLKRLPRAALPGTRWTYNTGETNLVGVLVHEATGRTLAGYLSEKIWRPFGMAGEAWWQVDEQGQEVAGCCLAATLRDWGRLGQFVLGGGRAGGSDVLPEGWIERSTAIHQPVPSGGGYGYLWWVNGDGRYSARGIFGQIVHVDPARRLVIVMLANWPSPLSEDRLARRKTMIEQITEALTAGPGRPSGLGPTDDGDSLGRPVE